MDVWPADLRAFIDRIRSARWSAAAGAPATGDGPEPGGGLFQRGLPATAARAPGRLDVMGGIADYSGSLVLQWPIREATRLLFQPRPSSRFLHIVSVGRFEGEQMLRTGRRVSVPMSLVADARPPYAALREWFHAADRRLWAAYVAGVLAVLAADRGVRLPDGASVLVESDVPEGKGVSSSAALETATMVAACGALGLDLDPREMATLCQRAENAVVGAPCGVMDQMASMQGHAGALMALLCQPAEFQGSVPLPAGLGVWGLDSGIRHAVSGADYGDVRVGAFIGYRILAELAGLAVAPGPSPGHVRVADPRWGGYLANVRPDEYRSYEPQVPETIDGRTFLERYGGTTDPVTTVEPDRPYAVRMPTAHPIYEHARVTEWARLLADAAERPGVGQAAPDRPAVGRLPPVPPAAIPVRLGALMYESHASYSACGLGSDGTDLLVRLVREVGSGNGMYGAKITGGGSGGTVAVLADREAGHCIRQIAHEYEARTGRDAYVFDGSSPGAAEIGPARVEI